MSDNNNKNQSNKTPSIPIYWAGSCTAEHKKTVFNKFWADYSSFCVNIDTRIKGCIVPAHLVGIHHVIFQMGRELTIPITDLTTSFVGFKATLSFNGLPFTVFVPWAAVFGCIVGGGYNVCFQDAYPKELRTPENGGIVEAPGTVSISRARQRQPIVARRTTKTDRPTHLKLV